MYYKKETGHTPLPEHPLCPKISLFYIVLYFILFIEILVSFPNN
jgi:hypothetical protein